MLQEPYSLRNASLAVEMEAHGKVPRCLSCSEFSATAGCCHGDDDDDHGGVGGCRLVLVVIGSGVESVEWIGVRTEEKTASRFCYGQMRMKVLMMD